MSCSTDWMCHSRLSLRESSVFSAEQKATVICHKKHKKTQKLRDDSHANKKRFCYSSSGIYTKQALSPLQSFCAFLCFSWLFKIHSLANRDDIKLPHYGVKNVSISAVVAIFCKAKGDSMDVPMNSNVWISICANTQLIA